MDLITKGKNSEKLAQHPFNVARDQVDFEIDPRPRLQAAERRRFERVRNQVDGKGRAIDGVGRQADAIDGDRSLARDVFGQVLRRADFEQTVVADGVEAQHFADAIDVARNQVAAETIGQAQGFLEIDRTGRVKADGARQRFRRNIDAEALRLTVNDGQADAVAGDRIADRDVVKVERSGVDGEANGRRAVVARRQFGNVSNCCDDSREHGKYRSYGGGKGPDFTTLHRPPVVRQRSTQQAHFKISVHRKGAKRQSRRKETQNRRFLQFFA